MNRAHTISYSIASILIINLFGTKFDLGQSATVQTAPIRIIVNADQRFQTIDGFGSSQRMWEDPHVANVDALTPDVPGPVKDTILRQLYTELGLTRVRMHGVGFNTEPVKGTRVFNCVAGEACAVDSRISYAKQALRYGLTTILSENNPMRWMDRSDPEDYADNTLAFLLHWHAMGVDPKFQTLMNEPSALDHPWPDAAWHLRVVRALGPRLRAAGLSTMLVIPDDLNACTAYPIAKTVLEDPVARQYVGAIAYHLYQEPRRSCRNDMQRLSMIYHVPVWMTEHVRDPGYEGSFSWAKEIHNLITQFGVSAVDIMWGFFGEWVVDRFNEEDLIQVSFDRASAHYISHRRTSKYYVTGQFSRFIRPGYQRVGASSTSNAILTSAYLGEKELAIVAINDSGSEAAADIVVQGVRALPSFSGIRTDNAEAWQRVPIVQTGTGFHAPLQPRSVTTFVGAVQ